MILFNLVPRFLAAFLLATLGISGIQFLKGHAAHDSLSHGLVWGAISSFIYILAYYANTRRSSTCPVEFDSNQPKE